MREYGDVYAVRGLFNVGTFISVPNFGIHAHQGTKAHHRRSSSRKARLQRNWNISSSASNARTCEAIAGSAGSSVCSRYAYNAVSIPRSDERHRNQDHDNRRIRKVVAPAVHPPNIPGLPHTFMKIASKVRSAFVSSSRDAHIPLGRSGLGRSSFNQWVEGHCRGPVSRHRGRDVECRRRGYVLSCVLSQASSVDRSRLGRRPRIRPIRRVFPPTPRHHVRTVVITIPLPMPSFKD